MFTLTWRCSRSWIGACTLDKESTGCKRCPPCRQLLSKRSGQPCKVKEGQDDRNWKKARFVGKEQLTHFPNPHNLSPPSPSSPRWSSSSSRKPSDQGPDAPGLGDQGPDALGLDAQGLGAPLLLHRAGAPCWWPSPPPPSPPGRTANWPVREIVNIRIG